MVLPSLVLASATSAVLTFGGGGRHRQAQHPLAHQNAASRWRRTIGGRVGREDRARSQKAGARVGRTLAREQIAEIAVLREHVVGHRAREVLDVLIEHRCRPLGEGLRALALRGELRDVPVLAQEATGHRARLGIGRHAASLSGDAVDCDELAPSSRIEQSLIRRRVPQKVRKPARHLLRSW